MKFYLLFIFPTISLAQTIPGTTTTPLINTTVVPLEVCPKCRIDDPSSPKNTWEEDSCDLNEQAEVDNETCNFKVKIFSSSLNSECQCEILYEKFSIQLRDNTNTMLYCCVPRCSKEETRVTYISKMENFIRNAVEINMKKSVNEFGFVKIDKDNNTMETTTASTVITTTSKAGTTTKALATTTKTTTEAAETTTEAEKVEEDLCEKF